MLDGVPSILPALSQAQELQDRAARIGFDWEDIQPVYDKVMEEFEEIKSAGSRTALEKELGDLLCAAVNLARWHGCDAESALRGTNLRFRSRFAYIEKTAREQQRDLQTMTLAEMDLLWEQAKDLES